jgi:hypothetical protein
MLTLWQESRAWLRRRRLTRRRAAFEAIERTGAVFVHIPKCAGKAVVTSLYGIGEHDWFGHAPIEFYRSVLGPAAFSRAFKFAVMRDPVARCLSAYLFARRGGFGRRWQQGLAPRLAGTDFAQFVTGGLLEELAQDDLVFGPQCRFLQLRDGSLGVDRVYDLSGFAGQFRALPVKWTASPELKKVNAAPEGDRQPVIEPQIEARIREIYRADYALLESLGLTDRVSEAAARP